MFLVEMEMHDNRENGRAKILGKSQDFFFFLIK
jgi:hypothetical protein